MNTKVARFFTLLLFVFVMLAQATSAEKGSGRRNVLLSPSSLLGTPIKTYFNINNISTVFWNQGFSDIDINDNNSGLVFPKGSRKTAVFKSGFVWGGKIGGEVRVGGSTYRTGLLAGRILPDGTPSDPDAAGNRIYRVRPDYRSGDLTSEISDEGGSAEAIRGQYATDWTDWPATEGAPFKDGNNDGVYSPALVDDAGDPVDVPGVPGADQTLWYVCNDFSSVRTLDLYGSQPMGIELQVTIFGYAQQGALGNMFFRKMLMINKGTNTIDSMFVSMWSDVDLGDSNDDYAGCDTTLSLGYVYNAFESDATYTPLPPPATGFDFFQGPVVNSPGDSAIFRGKRVHDKKNLPMTAFYYFIRGDANLNDPELGVYPTGTLQMYNFIRGRIGRTGQVFQAPDNRVTTFALDGDPPTGSGWIDGQLFPAGDRRIGSGSGPFVMAPGDSQEIVVAEICAGAIPGVSRLTAISLLKFYDAAAQLVYDNFFQVPPPPPAPKVTATEANGEIILVWGADPVAVTATETSDIGGFGFQGYNVYQFPPATTTIDRAKRIATYDIVDTVQVILDLEFDAASGALFRVPKQFGTNSGIKRSISIKTDALRGNTPLINGIRYYFAVTAYSFNQSPIVVPNNLENPPTIFTVGPHSANLGVTYGPSSGTELSSTHTGTASGGPQVTIVDPRVTTGHEYRSFFSERAEIRDPNGDWVPSSLVSKRRYGPNGLDTLTGSSIDIRAVYGTTGGRIELHCTLDLVSSDDAFADGIRMSLPPGLTILEAPSFDAGNGHIEPVIAGNMVIMGDTTHPYTGNGPFAGDEEWIIYVSGFTLPSSIDWRIFDDGFGQPLDAEGTTTVQAIGSASRLAKYWNVRDVTTGVMRLENQSLVDGVDLFPRRDDIITNLGASADPIIDGFQIGYRGVVYAAPINYLDVTLQLGPGSTTELTRSSSPTTLDIQNYTIFGGTVTSKSIDNFGAGTNDINELQKDYELRFTGVWDSVVVSGRKRYFIASGGQMATIFGTVSGVRAGLGAHPMNPNPGVNQPFLIRIPFEVWSIDDNRQVNLAFRDRQQAPTANPFYAWNPVNRMYAVIDNSAYDETTPRAPNASSTWVLVFYGTNYHLGDVVIVTYANPIQLGVDEWTFRTTEASYSSELAKQDLSRINVFPNPYYGVNTEEINKYQRFVTFSHLPDKAKIRIFSLAGILVRTIDHNTPSTPGGTQFERWDLANEAGLPVGSGIYIAHIDMPDLGTTKILKLAIIQEQQVLDRF